MFTVIMQNCYSCTFLVLFVTNACLYFYSIFYNVCVDFKNIHAFVNCSIYYTIFTLATDFP